MFVINFFQKFVKNIGKYRLYIKYKNKIINIEK